MESLDKLSDGITLLKKYIKELRKVGKIMGSGLEKLQEVLAQLNTTAQTLSGAASDIASDLENLKTQLANAATPEEIDQILGPKITELQNLANSIKQIGDQQ